MSNDIQATTYTDFGALTRLKGAARNNDENAAREVARQFEALLLQQLLKSMRAAGGEGAGLLDGEHGGMYRDMLDQQLSVSLAGRGGIGIADMVARQLGVEMNPPRPQSPPALGVLRQIEETGERIAREAPARLDVPATARSAAPPALPRAYRPDSPEAFVREMWPHAQGAARELGVDPRVLIAQAALETGWGRALPQRADGRSSNNLFGIKADPSWKGDRAITRTLEFEGGVPVRRSAAFRAYDSYAQSFSDYVQFLRENPRYRHALTQVAHGPTYLRALQRAGYATDPNYASKIQNILGGDAFDSAMSELKLGAPRPI